MGFETNDYLSWYIPRIRGADRAINLHTSGMPALTGDELAPVIGDPLTMMPRFEAALAGWLGIDAADVVFTPGGTGANLLALMTLARPGSAVLVETSLYEPMRRQAERLNHVRRLPRSFDDGWQLDPAVADLGGEVSLVMICEPHNPSGVAAPREAVLALAERCTAAGAILLINEVYRGFSELPSYHGSADSIVIVNSLSKLCGTYRARLGWLSASPEIAARLREAHLNLSAPSAPGAAVGLTVMGRIAEFEARARTAARSGVATVEAWVTATEGLSWHRPVVGFGCVKLPEGTDDLALTIRLHEEQGVLVIPGSLWEAPGTLRISWLDADDELERGLEQIAGMLGRR